MAKIIGVKFNTSSKIYYFAPANNEDEYQENSGVIVETAKGVEYAKVAFGIKEIPDSEIKTPLKPVIRKATYKDEKIVSENQAKVADAMKFAEEKIAERNLPMKLIDCEFSFDGKKLIYCFSADNRVDFRELVKDLAGKYHIRIELRQVGIRDETKILGGIAPCGRECCCASCLPECAKVSIKMAKIQGLHLNPDKISGLCGRLMCCLSYENDYYAEVYPSMPKIGGTVKSPDGEGIVVSNDMLKMISKIKITNSDGSEVYKDFPVERLEFKKIKQDEINNEDENDKM